MAGTGVAAGATITLSVRGSVNTTAGTDAIVREAMILQLTAQGFRVIDFQLQGGYGIVSRDYTGTVKLSPLGSTTVDRIVAAVRSALTTAGSYEPTISVVSQGEAAQTAPPASVVGATFEDLFRAVGTATTNIAAAPKDLTHSINLIVIGIVVIAVVVAFGPNIKDVARAAR